MWLLLIINFMILRIENVAKNNPVTIWQLKPIFFLIVAINSRLSQILKCGVVLVLFWWLYKTSTHFLDMPKKDFLLYLRAYYWEFYPSDLL